MPCSAASVHHWQTSPRSGFTRGTVVQQRTEIELRLGMVLRCCQAETLQGRSVVLRNTRAIEIHQAQIDLRIGIALLRRALVPAHGNGFILYHAVAAVVHQAEMQLRIRMPPGRRPAGTSGRRSPGSRPSPSVLSYPSASWYCASASPAEADQ